MDRLTEAELGEKLYNQYDSRPGRPSRNLHRAVRGDSHGIVGSVIYTLTGSPPKGYAIYIPDRRTVSIYDGTGKRVQHLRETRIVDSSGTEVHEEPLTETTVVETVE